MKKNIYIYIQLNEIFCKNARVWSIYINKYKYIYKYIYTQLAPMGHQVRLPSREKNLPPYMGDPRCMAMVISYWWDCLSVSEIHRAIVCLEATVVELRAFSTELVGLSLESPFLWNFSGIQSGFFPHLPVTSCCFFWIWTHVTKGRS